MGLETGAGQQGAAERLRSYLRSLEVKQLLGQKKLRKRQHCYYKLCVWVSVHV